MWFSAQCLYLSLVLLCFHLCIQILSFQFLLYVSFLYLLLMHSGLYLIRPSSMLCFNLYFFLLSLFSLCNSASHPSWDSSSPSGLSLSHLHLITPCDSIVTSSLSLVYTCMRYSPSSTSWWILIYHPQVVGMVSFCILNTTCQLLPFKFPIA